MGDWWRSLSFREQLFLSCAAVFLTGVCVFLLVLEPISTEQKTLASRLQAERGALARIEQYANEAQAIRARETDLAMEPVDKSISFLSILNRLSTEHQLQQNVKRIVPNGVDKASVVFDRVAFDRFTAWLIDLQVKHGVSVARITVDKTKDEGIVRSNVSLHR